MTRPRTYAIGIKVNPLFFENIMNIHWTCLLPHQSALCVLRYEDRRPQAGEEHPKGVGEGPQGHKEEEGVQQDQLCTSQATPCPTGLKDPVRTDYSESWRRSTPCARACTVRLYRAHGTPVRTGPTYPVRTGPTGWTAVIAVWASSSSTSSLTSSHLYIPYLDHLLGIAKYMR